MTAPRTTRLLALGVALQFGLANPALAGGDEFIGGLVGGVIGGIIGSQIGNGKGHAPRQQRPSKPRVRAPIVTPEQREENRRIQVSLNALECNAGTPDGAFGPRTRDAIRCFQAKVQAPITGTLTLDERQALLRLYADMSTPQGTAIRGTPVAGGGAAGLIETLKNRPPQPADPIPAAPPAIEPQATEPPQLQMAAAPVDLGDFAFCTPPTAAALPGLALPPPDILIDHVPVVGVCSLRGKLSADAAAGLKALGASQAEASAQCRGLAGPLAAAVGQIGAEPPDAVIASAYDAVGALVTDVDAAVGSARLCAGLGYQENDLALVEAASLFGAAVGDPSLIEAIGWDLAFGLGRAKDPAAGASWLREAADQMVEVDARLLLMPEADRTENLKAVAAVLAPAAPTTTAQPTGGFALPGIGTPVAATP